MYTNFSVRNINKITVKLFIITALSILFLYNNAYATTTSNNNLKNSINKLRLKVNSQQTEINKLKNKNNVINKNKYSDVKSGQFGGPFKVPGLGLEMKIGGFIAARTLYDSNLTHGPGPEIGFKAGGIPQTNKGHSKLQFSAQETRLNIDARKKTPYGPLRVYFEGDLLGAGGTPVATNGYGFRVRQAYGKIGHLLVGQAWSAFTMLPAFPSINLAFGDSYGLTVIRQPQIRWTQPITKGMSIELSAENPHTLAFMPSGGPPIPTQSHTPDGIVRLNINKKWGKFAFMYLARQLQVRNTSTEINNQVYGYGAKVSGRINIVNHNNFLKFNFMGGKGIGRYILDLATGGIGSATINPSTNRLDPIVAYGGNIQLGHKWTNTLSSVLIYSYTKALNKNFQPGNTYNHTSVFGGDLMWRIVPHVDLGLMYLYGQRVNKDGKRGHDNRFETIARFYY